MKKIINGHVYWHHTKYMEAPAYMFDMFDMRTWSEQSRDGRVHIKEHSFEVDVPDDFDPRPQQIAVLEAEKVRIRTEMARRVKELDDRIQSLLAIEMSA